MKLKIAFLLLIVGIALLNTIEATNMTVPSSYTYSGNWYQGWTYMGVCCYGGNCGQGYCSVDGDFSTYAKTGLAIPCSGNWSEIIKDYDIHKELDGDVTVKYYMEGWGTGGSASLRYYDFSTNSWVLIYTESVGSSTIRYYTVPKSKLYSNLTHYKLRLNISLIAGSYYFDGYYGSWVCSGGAQYYDDMINFTQEYVTKFVCQDNICCNYDEAPYLTKTIDWSCSTEQDAQCLIGLFWNNSLISVSPQAEDVPNYGRINILEAKNGLLNFRVDAKDLYPDETYTVRVFCHSNISSAEYTGTIVPQYGTGKEIPVLAVNFKENMPYIIGIIIGLMFLGLIIWALKIAWG
jgi:hypothetical protein